MHGELLQLCFDCLTAVVVPAIFFCLTARGAYQLLGACAHGLLRCVKW